MRWRHWAGAWIITIAIFGGGALRYQDKLAAIPKSGDLAARLEEEDGLFEEMQAEIARITFPMVRHKIG